MRRHNVATAPEAIEGFRGFLTRTGRSERTSTKYVQGLRPFAEWLGERPLNSVSSADLERYLDHWHSTFTTRKGRSPSRDTYRNHVTTVRTFFRYCDRTGLLVDARGTPLRNPAETLEVPRRKRKKNDWLRPDEDEALLAAAKDQTQEFIVWLLRWTGIRAGEAVAALIADIDLRFGQEALYVRDSKTENGHRTIPLTPELALKVRLWLQHLERQGLHRPNGPLLPTRTGQPMATTYIWRVVKRVAERAGVRPVACTCGSTSYYHEYGCSRSRRGENRSKVTPHTLRRTYGSYLLNKGVRLETVSKLLGHASTTITQQAYAELEDRTARSELLQALGHKAA